MYVSDDGMIVVVRYVAGNTNQQWFIEKDEIRCQHEDHHLSVGVEGPMMAGARCTASVNNNNNCWLFDQQYVCTAVHV